MFLKPPHLVLISTVASLAIHDPFDTNSAWLGATV